jgi:WD40 repeat protein
MNTHRLAIPAAVPLTLVALWLMPRPVLAAGSDLLGDHLPPGALLRLGSARLRHGGTVTAVAFSPDGTVLASAGADGVVHLWEVPGGRERRRLTGHVGEVRAVAFSPDGVLVASAGDDGIRIWDARQGSPLRRIAQGSPVLALAFSTDGKILTATDTASVRAWDVAQGTERSSFPAPDGGLRCSAVSPNGKTVAVAESGQSLVFGDLRTGKRREVAAPWLACLTFSPDGRLVASGDFGNAVRLWDPAAGREVYRFRGHGRPLPSRARYGPCVHAVAFSPDGKTLTSGGTDGAVRLWDTADGRELHRCDGHRDAVTAVAFSPDGRLVASGGADHTVRFWEAATGKPLPLPTGHEGGISGVAFAADGKVVATGADDGALRLWDRATGREVRRLTGHQGAVLCLAAAPRGQALASGGADGAVYGWDPAGGGQPRRLGEHRNRVAALAFSPDGRLLASGGLDHTVFLRDATTGAKRAELRLAFGQVAALAFDGDGRTLVCAATDGTVRLWHVREPGGDTVSVEEEPVLPSQHAGGLLSLAYAGDGRALATGGRSRRVHQWEMPARHPRPDLHGPPGWVTSLTLSPDGRLLVAGGSQGTLCLWDASSGRELGRLTPHAGPVRALVFAPDGKALATAGADTTALVWDVDGLLDAARPRPVCLTADELTQLWDQLGDADGERAYDAVRQLVNGAPGCVAFFRGRLRPVSTEQLARLLRDLDDADFRVREKASRELERLGRLIEPALHKTLDGSASAEVRRRVERLLEVLDQPAPTGQRLQALLGVEVLEQVGSPEARDVLRALAGGATDHELTQEARAALRRLAKRP